MDRVSNGIREEVGYIAILRVRNLRCCVTVTICLRSDLGINEHSITFYYNRHINLRNVRMKAVSNETLHLQCYLRRAGHLKREPWERC